MPAITSIQNRDEFTLKEKMGYAIAGVVVLGGAFFIGRSVVRKARSNSEEKKTYDDGNAAYYAQKLKLAFENDMWFGMGTDEEAVRDVIRSVPSRDEFKKVINSYQKLYARSLMMDMKDELTTTEYNEMLSIIAGKPEKITAGYVPQIGQEQYREWARRLKAAFDLTWWGGLPGTDEDAIKAVFTEIPTQADYERVAIAYKNEFGSSLSDGLKEELELWEYGPMMSIINNKPKV
jgi:hypothetical protein